MARYPRQDDKGGKNVIPSVTEIIGDCTDKSGALTQWAANMCKEWVIENCPVDSDKKTLSDGWIPTYSDPDNIGCAPQAEPMSPYIVYPDQLDEMRFNFKTVSQKALDIGSEVHGLIEKYLKDNSSVNSMVLPNYRDEVRNAFDAFWSWKTEHNLKPISLEQTVYGDGWAGTADFIGLFDDKLFVIDWKSSKAFYPEMRYQVAAYRSEVWVTGKECGRGFNHRADVQGCGILRLDKTTGEPSWHDTSKSYKQDLKIFNRMVDLYFERHPIIRKRARG